MMESEKQLFELCLSRASWTMMSAGGCWRRSWAASPR
jgi:hypothetical protein